MEHFDLDQAKKLIEALKIAGVQDVAAVMPAAIVLDGSFTADELQRIIAVLRAIEALVGA